MKTATIMILPTETGFNLNMSILNIIETEDGKKIDYANPIEVVQLNGNLQSILNLVDGKKLQHGI